VAGHECVIDVLFGGDGTQWLLYVAPHSRVGILGRRSGANGVVGPVPPPDLLTLDRFMREAQAPYETRPTRDGHAVQVVARGRSAPSLLAWLGGFLGDVKPATR
jgi:hypothetical protein